MWLFDRLGKGGNGQQSEIEKNKGEEDQERIGVYSGMRVEVTDSDGSLLFVAKLVNLRKDQAELQQYSETEFSKAILRRYAEEEAARREGKSPGKGDPLKAGLTNLEIELLEKLAQKEKEASRKAGGQSAEAPEKPKPLHVRIRGYNDHEKKAVYMEGGITPGEKHTWKVESLSVGRIGNDRAFFRLETDIEAVVTTFGGFSAGEQSCRMLNISVGGACILSEQKFREGDKFLLNVKLLEDRPVSVMFCEVLRIIEREDSKYEYGCRFLELNEEDQDKITQNIFAAQLAERRKKRGQA